MDCLGRASLSTERKDLKLFLTQDEVTSPEEGRGGGWAWQGNGNTRGSDQGRGVGRVGAETRENEAVRRLNKR